MKKKTVIVSILFGILLIGIVSASFLTYFGKITGSVEVTGPVFYLDGEHSDGGVYHKLYVNEEPSEEDIYFWDGHRLVFKTENLGVDEFYPIKFEAKIWIKTNNSGNTVQARFIQLDEDNKQIIICEVTEAKTIREIFWKETFSCESPSEINLINYDRIGMEIWGNGDENQEYWISVGKKYTDGISRIEVSAI